jgi:hypothetical protein
MAEVTRRTIGDLGAQALLDEDAAPEGVSIEEQVFGDAPMEAIDEPMTREPAGTPEEFEREMRQAMAAKIARADDIICSLVRTAKEEMRLARTDRSINLEYRYQIELERYRCEEGALIGSSGEAAANTEASHLRAGLTMGLFVDNVTTLGPMLVEGAIGGAGQPFVLEPLGKKSENEAKTLFFSEALKEQIESSNWREEIESAINELPKHGTCVIRQSWAEEIELVQIEPGVYDERIRRKGMAIKHWPLLDCYVSHPNCATAEEQESVIWYSNVTVSDLARHERVLKPDVKIDYDPTTGAPIPSVLEAERGRFVGLERIRRAEGKRLAANYEQRLQVNVDMTSGVTSSVAAEESKKFGSVSARMQIDLNEKQGSFPMGALVREGFVDHEYLAYHGVQLIGPGGQMLEGEALARMCDRLMWYVTVAETDGGGAEGSQWLIELRPCPYRKARTELKSAVFLRDGHRFYGLSADAVGHDVSTMADKIFNDLAMIVDNNADPPMAYLTSAFDDAKQAETWTAAPGSRIGISNGGITDLKQAIAFFERPWDELILQFLQLNVDTYRLRTMATAAQAGAQASTESKTYSEVSDQLQQAQKRVYSIIRQIAEMRLIVPSIKHCLEDLCWFMDADELRDYADRVGGELALNIERILPSAREDEDSFDMASIADDFIVKHSGNPSIPREVAIQFLLGTAAAEVADPMAAMKMRQEAIRLQGLDPEKFYSDQEGPLSPAKELRLILGGDSPKPNPAEDPFMHWQAHQQQKAMLAASLEQLAAEGKPTKFIEGALYVLDQHIADTEELMQAMLSMMQQQSQAEADGGGGGKEGDGKKKGNPPSGKPNTPPGAQQMMGGIRTAAGANFGG